MPIFVTRIQRHLLIENMRLERIIQDPIAVLLIRGGPGWVFKLVRESANGIVPYILWSTAENVQVSLSCICLGLLACMHALGGIAS